MNNSNCKMIWTDVDCDIKENLYVHFRTAFFASPKVDQNIPYTFKISADSQYALWINDNFVNYGQYADFPVYKCYDILDITDYIVPGENKISILAYYQGQSSFTYITGRAGILFTLEEGDRVVAQSDANVECAVADEYKNGPMERITGQLGYSFEYDATKIDGRNWQNAVVVGSCIRMNPRPIPKMIIESRRPGKIISQGVYKYSPDTIDSLTACKMQQAYLSARLMSSIAPDSGAAPFNLDGTKPFSVRTKCDDGVYVIIDLGKETAGIFDLEIEAERGTVVNIGYGEHLDDLRVRTNVGGRCFSGKYTCKGNGIEHFTHFNKRFGCRYIELMVESGNFDLYYAGVLPTVYPVKNVGRFGCCDSLHNKIHDVCIDTLKLCMHEHYEDTPWREQALYAMDSRNQILCGYYAFGEFDMPKASIRLLALSQLDNGLLEICAPAKSATTIPSFSLQWILELYEYVLYSGDTDFAYEMWPYAERIISAFWRKAGGRDLVGPWFDKKCWEFYEWMPGLCGGYMSNVRDRNNRENYDAPLSCFYMIALDSMVKIAKWLVPYTSEDIDFMEKASWYEMLASGIRDSFDDVFWNEDKGCYASFVVNGELTNHFCKLTNALALYAKLVPEDKIFAVADKLAYDDTLIDTSLSASIFKYEALLMLGDTYAQFVFDQIGQKWGRMLYSGATSFWETEKGAWDFDNAGSLCHGWSAVPLLLYYKYLLGVSPKTKGFEDYTFKPLRTSIIEAHGNIIRKNAKPLFVGITPQGVVVEEQYS